MSRKQTVKVDGSPPAISSSAARRSSVTASSSAMAADSLPSIDFGFNDLRERMARFTVKFDEFIERSRKRVLDERNHFRVNIAELQEDQRMKQKDLEILALKAATLAKTADKEAAEAAEMQRATAAITAQHAARASARDALRRQIAATQRLIAQRVAAQQQHAAALDAQARFNEPELGFWQSYLSLRIEGAGAAGRLHFVFSQLDERDAAREAWFELDTGARAYRVLQCTPRLDEAAVQRAVDGLNDGRSLGPFLKEMRQLFVAATKKAAAAAATS